MGKSIEVRTYDLLFTCGLAIRFLPLARSQLCALTNEEKRFKRSGILEKRLINLRITSTLRIRCIICFHSWFLQQSRATKITENDFNLP